MEIRDTTPFRIDNMRSAVALVESLTQVRGDAGVASSEALRCVLEQDNLSSAEYRDHTCFFMH